MDHTKQDDIITDHKSRYNENSKAKMDAPIVFSDYLTTGSVIGEAALLTNTLRNATISCETSAQVDDSYLSC